MEPIKFNAILIVGDSAPKFAELTHEEIQTLWQDIQARSLPKVRLGWFDEKYQWTQLSTNPRDIAAAHLDSLIEGHSARRNAFMRGEE